MSSYYVWIDLLMNYNYFNTQLGNIITTLEQYNVHNKWYCFLFDTLNLDTDEDLYQQKRYYTNDVLNVLRNNFVPSSYADQQFMALVLAKDVIYDFFKAIPNAFDNIQLRPCYSLVYPELFLDNYFNIIGERVTENICGYELREAVRTMNISPVTPEPPIECFYEAVDDFTIHTNYDATTERYYIYCSWINPDSYYVDHCVPREIDMYMNTEEDDFLFDKSKSHHMNHFSPHFLPIIPDQFKTYTVRVVTRWHNGHSKQITETVGPFIPAPTPPPTPPTPSTSCGDCAILKKWYGNFNTAPISALNGTGDSWGFKIDLDNNIPYKDCIQYWVINLYKSSAPTISTFTQQINNSSNGLKKFKLQKHSDSNDPTDGYYHIYDSTLLPETDYILKIQVITNEHAVCINIDPEEINITTGKSTGSGPPGPTPPTPPPKTDCSNTKQTLWFGTIDNPVSINGRGDSWGFQMNCDGIISNKSCIDHWIVNILEEETLNQIFTITIPESQGLGPIIFHAGTAVGQNENLFGRQYYYSVNGLLQETPYIVHIEVVPKASSPKIQDIIKNAKTGKQTAPPTPTPTPIGDAPELYITTYGQASFSPFKGDVSKTIFADFMGLDMISKKNIWKTIRAWHKIAALDYINFVVNNSKSNIVNIMWRLSGHRITPPPTKALTNNIVEDKNLFVGDTIYCAPNGATDFGLPASAAGYYDDGDLSWIGCPIILDFLIPLAEKCKSSKPEIKCPEITIQVYPDPGAATYMWDVGNYGKDKNDTRMGQYFNDGDGTSTISLYYYTQYKDDFTTTRELQSWWTPDKGNNYISNGTGNCTGRPPYYSNPLDHTSTNYTTPPTFNECDYNGSNNTYKVDADSSAIGYPLDDLHQFYISIYYINQKILEYNWCIDNVVSYNGKIKCPLITHIHYDGEGGAPYTAVYNDKLSENPLNNVLTGGYPQCNPDGDIKLPADRDSSSIRPVLGDPVCRGYAKYLHNKYMPAECLPEWRLGGGTKAMSFTPSGPSGLKVPHSDDILWDQSKAWNIGQSRNYHQEPSVTNGGYTNLSNDFNSVKHCGSGHDGIQRYQYGTIAYTVAAFSFDSKVTDPSQLDQGIIESFSENYNIGEVEPPVSKIPAPGTGSRPYNADDLKALTSNTLNTNDLPKQGSGELIINKNVLVQGIDSKGKPAMVFTNGLGSACMTGKFCPDCSNSSIQFCDTTCKTICGDVGVGVNYENTQCVKCVRNTFCKNQITNTLHSRIWDSYGTNFEGSSQTSTGTSPAMTDIYQRFDAIYSGVIPLDGRGYKSPTTGINPPQQNPSKNTDGFYCPIDSEFIDLDTGKIKLNGKLYPSTQTQSIIDGKSLGTENTIDMIGPQGEILTIQAAYRGAVLTPDPSISGPNWPVSFYPHNQSNLPDGALFTMKGQTMCQKVFEEMVEWCDKNDSKIYTTDNWIIKADDKCFKNIGYDGGVGGAWGDNCNALGVLQDEVSGFTYMNQLIKALGNIMCGPDNCGKAKIAIYSYEFMPVAWSLHMNG